MTRTGTALRRLAHVALQHSEGIGLDEWVGARREQGQSWRRIAIDLEKSTGVDVTHEAMRRWYVPEGGAPAADCPEPVAKSA